MGFVVAISSPAGGRANVYPTAPVFLAGGGFRCDGYDIADMPQHYFASGACAFRREADAEAFADRLRLLIDGETLYLAGSIAVRELGRGL